MLLDLLSLFAGTVGLFLVKNPRGFWLSLVIGVLLAALCWYSCSAYTRLWNRRFHLKAMHHALCALAAFLTLFFSVFYPALTYVGQAGDISIALWQATVQHDPLWAAATFRSAWEAVSRLGVEDLTSVPRPGSPGSWIPTTSDKSRQAAASAYASSACLHFARTRPFLSKIVWARPGIPADVVFGDVHRWHQHNPNYPPERAIGLAVSQIRAGLTAQVPQLVTICRLLAVLLFVCAQAIPFGFVGWAAYRDIRVRA